MPALIKHYIGGDNELKKNTELSSSESVSRPIIHRNLTMKTFLKQAIVINNFSNNYEQADNNEMALRWQKYKKEIERQFRFFGITEPVTKKDGLLIYGGQDLVDVDDALPDPTSIEGDDVYKVLIRKIDKHFIPKQSKGNKNRTFTWCKLSFMIGQFEFEA